MGGRQKIAVVTYPVGRVGSSATMGLLSLAGFHVGNDPRITEPAAMNPKGFFELPEQEELLREIYAGVYPHIALPPPMETISRIAEEHWPRYRKLVTEEFGGHDLIALKSQWYLTLPFLSRMADEFDIRILELERNEHDQVASLLRVWKDSDDPVRKFSSPAGVSDFLATWKRFGNELIDQLGMNHRMVSFDRMTSDPVAEAQEICAFLDTPPPPDDAIHSWFDPKLVNRRRLELLGQSRPKISLVVNTLNSEERLEACLRSAESVVDEMVVVDMHSTDGTVEIAARYTDQIYSCSRTGYVEPARNFAIDKASGDWILILDSDELLSRPLADGIRSSIAGAGATSVFRIPRRNQIAGRWMQGTGFGQDVELQPRLFRKGALTWTDIIHSAPTIHEPMDLIPLGEEAVILHYPYPDLASFVERLNRYTDFEAAGMVADGDLPSAPDALRHVWEEFAWRYEPKKDGAHSLILSAFMAFYKFAAWAKRVEGNGFRVKDLPSSAADIAALLTGDAPPAGETISQTSEIDRLKADADLEMERSDYRKAARHLQSALKIAPDDSEVLLSLGNCCRELGDIESAEEAYSLVLRLDGETNGHVER